jgi:GNAT superfamily N-acetyltransferase
VFEPGDIEQAAALRREEDHNDHWRDVFRWKFLDNPARRPERPYGWVLEDQGRIVGLQMGMPHCVSVLGKPYYAGFSGDTLLHPDYRGQGWGRRLTEAYVSGQRGGLALTTTANVTAGNLMWLGVGAMPIGSLRTYYQFRLRVGRPILDLLATHTPWLPLKRVSADVGEELFRLLRPRHIAAPGFLNVEPVAADDSRLDEIWSRLRNEYRIMVIRDQSYRVWRYAQAPPPRPSLWIITAAGGQSVAWFSLRLTGMGQSPASSLGPGDEPKLDPEDSNRPKPLRAELLDAFGPADDPGLQRGVLACALRQAYDLGADSLRVAGLHPTWRRHLDELGFGRRLFNSHPFLCINCGDFDRALLESPDSWHLCAADGDLAV